MVLYQVCLSEGPRVKDGLAPGGQRWSCARGPRVKDGPAPGGPEIHRKILKNPLLQNHLAQMLEIW